MNLSTAVFCSCMSPFVIAYCSRNQPASRAWPRKRRHRKKRMLNLYGRLWQRCWIYFNKTKKQTNEMKWNFWNDHLPGFCNRPWQPGSSFPFNVTFSKMAFPSLWDEEFCVMYHHLVFPLSQNFHYLYTVYIICLLTCICCNIRSTHHPLRSLYFSATSVLPSISWSTRHRSIMGTAILLTGGSPGSWGRPRPDESVWTQNINWSIMLSASV